jgi:4-hydroxy-2-oxoglutarate aldolase
MTNEVLYRYFIDLASSTMIPCLVYNAPQFSGGVSISAALAARLGEHENIIGIKDSANAASIAEYLFKIRDSLSVLAGSADFFLSSMILGAVGGVLSLANIFPVIMVEFYRLIMARRWDEVFILNKKILCLNKGVSGSGGVAAVKRSMDLVGLTGGDPRLPLAPLSNEDTENLVRFLQECQMLQ